MTGRESQWGGKNARLEQDFEQLFGPHYHSGPRAGHQCTAEEEVRDYLQTPQIPTMQNPLRWWAENEDRFPRLAKLGRRYLAVPATSTPSERIFFSSWKYDHATAGEPSSRSRRCPCVFTRKPGSKNRRCVWAGLWWWWIGLHVHACVVFLPCLQFFFFFALMWEKYTVVYRHVKLMLKLIYSLLIFLMFMCDFWYKCLLLSINTDCCKTFPPPLILFMIEKYEWCHQRLVDIDSTFITLESTLKNLKSCNPH